MAGGGSAGHITPNIALLEELVGRVPKLDILYVGSKKGLEHGLISQKGWPFKAISCGKLRRYFSLENFLDFFRSWLGLLQSLWIIWRFKPDVIFCKGGYVSLPVAVAGGLLRKAVVIHESDLEMGLANKIASRFARVICVSFSETLERRKSDKRVVLTGNPVRAELFEGDTKRGYKFCGFSSDKKVLLVMGGSQGAVAINGLIERHLDELLKRYQVIHICGKGNVEDVSPRDGYFIAGYLGEELRDIYAICDLVVGRAGANSLAEFEALGIPAILIPLVAGSRGDQIKNAESFVKHNPGLVLEEKEIKADSFDLIGKIDKLSRTISTKKKGSQNKAASIIADILIETTHHGGKN